MLMQETTNQTRSTVPQSAKRNYLGIGLALLLVTAAFFSGLQLGENKSPGNLEANLFSFFSTAPQKPDDADLTEFWRVWDLLDEKFVVSSSTKTLTTEDKIRGAIDGLVATYDDPYTIYLPPDDANYFGEDISGNFGGVGMEVGIRNGVITVISPLPDTPAANAGILPGDIIAKIDGVSTQKMGIDEAVRLIRGEIGTEVALTIAREGETDFLEIIVVRDNITIPTVETELRDGVYIISLYNFNAISEMKMQEALRTYVESGSRKLVLDLRGNPGGFLQSAVAIASYFLPTGKPVVREGFGDEIDGEVFRSTGRTLREFAPEEMVVLINGGSASASEILAGALSEHGVATLMGDTSFGKGSVQELIDLPDGSALKVTIARWYTPNGVSISDGGLDPDIFVERTAEQILSDVDPQLDAALEWLHGNKNVGTTTKPTN